MDALSLAQERGPGHCRTLSLAAWRRGSPPAGLLCGFRAAMCAWDCHIHSCLLHPKAIQGGLGLGGFALPQQGDP